MVADISLQTPLAAGVYWVRRDKDNGKRPHGFTRHRVLQHSYEEVSV